MSAPELAAGVIHDIGYRHHDGPRLGRRHATLAVYLHTLRGMYGLGRPARAKVVPLLLLGITVAPAAVSGALAAATPLPAIPYTSYAYVVQVAIVVFLAAQAAQTVTGDIRFRVLSLYFSRPLERAAYVWAKLAALASGMLVLLGAPLLVIYAAVLLAHTHSASDAAHETGRLLTGLGGSAVHAVLLASLGMAVAAMTRVRAFAVVGIAGLYLVATSASILSAVVRGGGDLALVLRMVSPFSLLDGFQVWALRAAPVVPPGPGHLGWAYGLTTAALVSACAAFLHWRYRRIES